MIVSRIEKRYGTATVKVRVIAPSIGQALELYGEDADVVLASQLARFLALEGPAGSMKQTKAGAGERRAEAA